ncbi:ATP-binding protein [Candidatus Cloacimonas acidaminovorans]|uniref:histidine kinase n=1 Tax=Cloacimonas acidaminovorans (strain Evry) TaxID=459349 RepID=B0VEU8_CLOAI|nr:ATP-binding protein [Candidatus Cloacimonas acidaminovorans]CAO81264.1 putative Histidine kinase [Candidatus Cloacimonas acidaminovorans str. Evry]
MIYYIIYKVNEVRRCEENMQDTMQKTNIGIFSGLSEEVVEELTKDLERIKFKKGESIITEHSLSDNLFFISKGKVEIDKDLSNPDIPFTQLSTLEAGDFFGEMGIIEDSTRSASVVATEDVELMVIPREAFSDMLFAYPIIMLNLTKVISSRLRNTNERFVELMDEMLKKNRLMAIGLAASKIIHDIKTPLTVIVLTAQLLENIFPESAEFTDNIVKQTKLIDQLVHEILDFARGTESPPLIQKVNLDSFLREVSELYSASFKERKIIFVVENKVNDCVYFDEGKIRRVLINLIKNALEAIPEAGEIKIISSVSSGWLQISVIDNGPGVSRKVKEELFQPFVTDGKTQGTGLGLAICKKLVQEHYGRLEYIPVEPHGSRFDIRIPQSTK